MPRVDDPWEGTNLYTGASVRGQPGPERGEAMNGHPHGADWGRAREAAWRLGARSAAPAAQVPLDAALGATLAEDLVALVGAPSYDAAAMDGYAVAGDGPWRVVGGQLAGAPAAVSRLEPGQALEIATGARVPPGTVSVLPYEQAKTEPGLGGGKVHGQVAPGRHVRWAGEETASGEVALPAGSAVTPAALGLAASLGHDVLRVRRPRVTALITGAELTRSGLPEQGSVRDAIGPMLPGLVGGAGGDLVATSWLGDGRAELLTAVRGAAPSEVVAVCGSSSKGPADHLRAVLHRLGAHILVDGVACRPGHPQLLGHLGAPQAPGPIVVGLPGNPGAALAAAVTLLAPVLGALAGRPRPLRRVLPVHGTGIVPHHSDTRLVAVRLDAGSAVAVGHDRPASLRGAAAADAYAVIPPDWDGSAAELVRLPQPI